MGKGNFRCFYVSSFLDVEGRWSVFAESSAQNQSDNVKTFTPSEVTFFKDNTALTVQAVTVYESYRISEIQCLPLEKIIESVCTRWFFKNFCLRIAYLPTHANTHICQYFFVAHPLFFVFFKQYGVHISKRKINKTSFVLGSKQVGSENKQWNNRQLIAVNLWDRSKS